MIIERLWVAEVHGRLPKALLYTYPKAAGLSRHPDTAANVHIGGSTPDAKVDASLVVANGIRIC